MRAVQHSLVELVRVHELELQACSPTGAAKAVVAANGAGAKVRAVAVDLAG